MLQATSDLITCTKNKGMIETDCTITLEGKSFTSGGAWLWPDKKTGKHKGILYAYPEEGMVGTWDGSVKMPARFGHISESGFRDYHGFPQKNQHITFEYEGVKYSGMWYNKDWSNIVRVREVSS